MTRSREEIIQSMCLTWDHSYMAPTSEVFPGVKMGLTQAEKESLFRQMAQLFDNDIAPYMTFKKTRREKKLASELKKDHGFGYDTMRRGK